MSERAVWKLIHLLSLYGRPSISEEQLTKAGADFNPRTFIPLENSGSITKSSEGGIELSPAVRQILLDCVVANQTSSGINLRPDYPQVFVAMAFGEEWSDDVYEQLIRPAVEAASLECVRGDETIRIGDLSNTIWKGILESGLVIAECSVPNVNVFYELGLTHALGKDTLVIMQSGTRLPADMAGQLYIEYDLSTLSRSVSELADRLVQWAKDRNSYGVRELARSVEGPA